MKQISAWRQERLEDAAVLSTNPFVYRGVQQWLESSEDASLKGEILHWMESRRRLHDYDTVLLLDTEGKVLLSTHPGERPDRVLLQDLRRVVDSKAPTLSDLHHTDRGIRLCLYAPISNPQDPRAHVAAILVFVIDPHKFLYPLIQSWPTPSRTSETLLVRNEKGEVLYLNELRHRKGAALSLRRPLNDHNLPAARAVQHEEGAVEGMDYRGFHVLASIRAVADTPWFLVTKMDVDELYAPLRERARLIAAGAGLIIFGAAVSFFLILSRQQQQDLKKVHDELERHVQERTEELAKVNEALRLDEARLGALLELSHMSNASIEEIADFALEQQVGLTKSNLGFLGFLSENEAIFTLHAWSGRVTEQCNIQKMAGMTMMHHPVERAGVWAEAVRKRMTVIVNDFNAPDVHKKGYPEGHIQLHRLMSIPVFDGDRIVAVAVVADKNSDYDASDERQLTLLMDGMWRLIQKQKSEKLLREAESLSAIGRALSGVAHDMKTPLIAIGGFTQIVHRHLDEANPDRAKLEIVLKETQRLENMVKDMLDFARPLELDRSENDINAVVSEVTAVVAVLARQRKVNIQAELGQDLPGIAIDGMRMKQAIMNLVVNAVQASPEEEVVKIRTHQSQGKLIVDVIDRGCGIPPEKKDEIFLPFVSTKKEGTGLGLAIVKRIVEAHQGRIDIMDNSQKGVTFRVLLS